MFFILLVENIGIPFPAETTLTIAGFEWMRGAFSLVPLLLAATFGNVVGSTIGYGIGYFLGRPVIVRLGRYVGITSEKLEAADQKFARYRGTLVLFGKFIAGIRILVPYLAGINRMPFVVFSAYNAVSALVWAGFFIIVGRYGGGLVSLPRGDAPVPAAYHRCGCGWGGHRDGRKGAEQAKVEGVGRAEEECDWPFNLLWLTQAHEPRRATDKSTVNPATQAVTRNAPWNACTIAQVGATFSSATP